MRRSLPRISRDRADRVLLNPNLSRQLLSDLGYSCDYPEARAMGVGLLGHGWQAWLPAPKASRSEAMILAPNGRICRLESDAVVSYGSIDLLRSRETLSYPDAVRYLERTYLGIADITALELAHNRRLPAERRRAAEEEAANQPARDPAAQEGPGLQPGAGTKLTPAEALALARKRCFDDADPDPGTGYLVTHRHIDPAIVRRFGVDRRGRALLRYDAPRDEVMIIHLNAAGRFSTYEYRGGVTPLNRKSSRGNAAGCLVGLAILGEPERADRLVVLESGIEALSCLEMEEHADPATAARSCYLSCAGGPKPEQLDRIAAWAAASGATIALSFNDDPAGQAFCARARQALLDRGMEPARIETAAPLAWDWNLALKISKGVEDREVLRWNIAQGEAATR